MEVILVNPEPKDERDGAPLTDKLLAAVTRHLNHDHFEDLLACAKATASWDWAEQARVVGLDAAGMDLEVRNSNHVQCLRLDFPKPAKGVLSLRRALGIIMTESRAKLGWAAATDDHTGSS